MATTSVLAFDRRLSSSNGLFYGVKWEEREQATGRPLPVLEKSVRGVIDHYLKASQASLTKVEANIESPNLQTVDYCTLGMDEDTLLVKFNIQLAGAIKPCACNDPEVENRVLKMVESFGKKGFKELCRRYVINLANGRFLWRNRLGAEKIFVTIDVDGNSYTFDALSISTRDFEIENEQNRADIDKISDRMSEVLSGECSHVNLAIRAWVKKFPGLEVFPSQELVTDNSSGKGKKSKFLFAAEAEGVKAAALHPQKITNAIHTIDNWYKDANTPISVNSYGAVTSQGKAYRMPRTDDFYTLFDKAVNDKDGLAALDENQQKYVMAMLVRGGVFGEGGE
ncbi:MAG: type I-F CRISPR-associated protein Csy3 [Desulfococcus sp. 4484_241]|nr:MAG: type I-F CRISPR-associated protein Csy3 [Desulfococcus sp. 4484_241]